MGKVMCPNCGTEFFTEDDCKANGINIKHGKRLVGDAYLVPKKIHNDNVNNFKETYDETKVNENKEEKNTMNMNNISIEELTNLVVAQMAKGTVNNVEPTKDVANETVNGDGLAKTSQYYGKTLCGYVFNPYTMRRWLPRKFKDMMDRYDLNVDKAIRYEVEYMDSIEYMIRECGRLAKMKKVSPIAFDERKMFWSGHDCSHIFIDYLENVKKHFDNMVENGKDFWIGGKKITVKHKEVVENHKVKVVHYVDPVDEVIKHICDYTIGTLKYEYDYGKLHDIMKGFKLVKLPSMYYTHNCYSYSKRGWVTENRRNPRGFKLHKAFVEGYKKSGAYYTIKHYLIEDNEAVRNGKYVHHKYYLDGEYCSKEAMDYLRSKINEPAYILYAKLKGMLGYRVIG